MVDNIELVKDKSVVAVIDFGTARSSIAARQRPEGRRHRPHGHFHKVHHRAGNPKGTYEDDSPESAQTLWHPLGRFCCSGTERARRTRSPPGGLRRKAPP